jgi:hypothetical protein
MDPHDGINPYVCYSFPLPDPRHVMISQRKQQIYEDILEIMHHDALEGCYEENLSRFNALIMLTGGILSNLIVEGYSAKTLWSLYSQGVQQIVNNCMLEHG